MSDLGELLAAIFGGVERPNESVLRPDDRPAFVLNEEGEWVTVNPSYTITKDAE